MAEKEIIIGVKVEIDSEAATKNLLMLNKAIDEQKQKQKELKKQFEDGKISYEEYNEQLEDSRTIVTRYSEKQRELRKEIQNNIKVEKQHDGSLRQLRAALSNLTAEYDNLSKAERDSAKGKELQDKINAVTNELKVAEESTGRFSRNVGNYLNSFSQALETNVPAISQVKQAIAPLISQFKEVGSELRVVRSDFREAISGLSGMTTAQKAATVATAGLSAGMKILKIAIVSTGVGAFVVLLGSLVAYLTSTQEGTEKLSKAFAWLKAALDVIIDRFAKFGGAIMKFFSGDFSGAAEDAKAAFAGVGKELETETELAVKLREALNKIEKEEKKLIAVQQARKTKIAELKQIADDTTKSDNDRLKAAREILDLEKQTAEEVNRLGEARIANMLGYTEVTDEVKAQIEALKNGTANADQVIANLGLSNSTIKDYEALNNEIAKYQQRVSEFSEMQVEANNKINTIIKERQNKEKANADAAIAAQKIIDEETKKMLDEQAREQMEHDALMIKTKLELAVKGSEEELNLKIEQLNKERDKELETALLTEEEKQKIRDNYKAKAEQLEIEYRNRQKEEAMEALELELSNRLAAAKIAGEDELQVELENAKKRLDSLQQLEGESDAEFKARQLEAQQEYLDAKEELAQREIEIEQAKFEAASQITGALSGLFEQLGEDNKAFAILSKTLALAEIAINTGKAISEGVASAAGLIFPANIPAIASTIATVIANMTTAISLVKSAKFADGGLVEGPGTGTSDSIPAMLSNGESVMTARATSMFAPLLSAINVAGGGVPIQVREKSSQALGEEMIARAIARGMQDVHPIVSVTEINKVGSQVKVVENLGSI